jgi:hypothetical protein
LRGGAGELLCALRSDTALLSRAGSGGVVRPHSYETLHVLRNSATCVDGADGFVSDGVGSPRSAGVSGVFNCVSDDRGAAVVGGGDPGDVDFIHRFRVRKPGPLGPGGMTRRGLPFLWGDVRRGRYTQGA